MGNQNLNMKWNRLETDTNIMCGVACYVLLDTSLLVSRSDCDIHKLLRYAITGN